MAVAACFRGRCILHSQATSLADVVVMVAGATQAAGLQLTCIWIALQQYQKSHSLTAWRHPCLQPCCVGDRQFMGRTAGTTYYCIALTRECCRCKTTSNSKTHSCVSSSHSCVSLGPVTPSCAMYSLGGLAETYLNSRLTWNAMSTDATPCQLYLQAPKTCA